MQANSEYLTLALDVRKVTDSLVHLVEEGNPSPELNASIQQVMTSLQGPRQISAKSLRARGPFGRYAGVKAISEVFTQQDRTQLIGKLHMVIQPQPSAQRTESALAAIEFFDKLERRALYHYNRARTTRRSVSAR
jgi:hypothetical protein